MFEKPFNNKFKVSKCAITKDKITVSLQSDLDESSSDDEWISTYCAEVKNDKDEIRPSWFCKIDKSFFEKNENLIHYDGEGTNENSNHDMVSDAILLITEKYNQEKERIDQQKEIKLQCLAEHIYGLFHAKYILTQKGMQKMREKFKAKHWGACPRYFCYQNPVLPYGKSDIPGVSCVQVYCPICKEVYDSFDKRARDIDGAYFGPTFAIMFCKFYPELSQCEKPEQKLNIHGFSIADYKDDNFFTMTVPDRE